MFIVKERFVLKSSYVLWLQKFWRDWKRAFKNKKNQNYKKTEEFQYDWRFSYLLYFLVYKLTQKNAACFLINVIVTQIFQLYYSCLPIIQFLCRVKIVPGNSRLFSSKYSWRQPSPGGSVAKNPTAGNLVLTLGQEFLLKKGIATHSSVLTWRIPCTEEAGGHGPSHHRVQHDWSSWAQSHTPLSNTDLNCIGPLFFFYFSINMMPAFLFYRSLT